MSTNLQSLSPNNDDAKAAFRKPSNDAAKRKYRRRSLDSGSSSSDGSPNRERSSSPISPREKSARVSDFCRRKDDEGELDKDTGKRQLGRSGDSHRNSDRNSSRNAYNYHRHDDYIRREKHLAEEEKNYLKPSSRSGREFRGSDRYDNPRREGEHNRSSEHFRDVDKNSRDKSDGSGHRSRGKERETSSREYKKYRDKDSSSDRAASSRRDVDLNFEESKSRERDRLIGDKDVRDEKRDNRKSSVHHGSDRSPAHREHRADLTSRRDSSGHWVKEASKSDPKEEEKNKYDDREANRHKERYNREAGELFEEKIASREKPESDAKKPKFSSSGRVSKFSSVADERQTESSKQAGEFVGKVTSEQPQAKDSDAANDIDAAKVAAIKAAELVNRNLVGTSLSTDQKKKLLWGSKKNTAVEESGHRWDATLFSDRERQEKFNKLMGVKGEVKVEHKPDEQNGGGLVLSEKQKEVQLDLERQYTAGLRRRDGRTVGLGL